MGLFEAIAPSVALVGLLTACVAPSEVTRAAPSESTRVMLGKATPTEAAPKPKPEKAPTPPPVFYLAHDQLGQLQVDGTTRIISGLGNEGPIMSAIKVEESVFVLGEAGLQRVDLKDGTARMVIQFHVRPLFGDLVGRSSDEVLLYSTALESGCSPTGIGATLGLYELATGEASVILGTHEGYVRVLGLGADHRSIYALPVGCDPEFDELWQIRSDNGATIRRLPTSDAATKEYGHEYAALSPDARALAFTSSRYLESENMLSYRLSVYDLDTLAIERYELPNPPSHIWGGLVWSSDSRWLYFVIDAGSPEEEPSRPYGLWALNTQEHSISRIADLNEPAMHLLGISPDDVWLLLAPERQQTVTYIYLPTGEQILLQLPPEGVDAIVH